MEKLIVRSFGPSGIQGIDMGRITMSMKGERELATALAKGQESVAITWQKSINRRIRPIGSEMLRYAQVIVHKITGALQASLRLKYHITDEAAFGTLYLDPTVENPMTGQLPFEYGPFEHARGGSHAFFDRTFVKFQKRAAFRFMQYVLDDLPK